MRNGKTLLRWKSVLVVLAVMSVGAFCAAYAGGAHAAESSGERVASDVMVMFPATKKPELAGKGMPPVAFNHAGHEAAVSDCETCHHTGSTVSCAKCHTVETKATGKVPSLYVAMHKENIAKRAKGNTPSSCVSCHNAQLQRKECAGCHNLIAQPARSEQYCAVCHNVKATPEQMKLGALGKLPDAQKEALAEAAQAAAKPVTPIGRDQVPALVVINALSDKFYPTRFSHGRHVGFLQKRIKGDKIAAAFHAEPATTCTACHHHSPLSATPPKCASCHSIALNQAYPARPTLKAAYHLQCMGCHTSMQTPRPKNTSCNTCHKVRAK